MATLTSVKADGTTWTPQFLVDMDITKCLGCGRCFKVCGHNVMALRHLDEEGEFIDEDDDGDIERSVMTVAHPELCIGCQACSRVCPKSCHVYSSLEVN
jgi:Nif-specific ferredoxin III